MNIHTLPTPTALVDERRMQHNIRRMHSRVAALGARLRPHVKTAKCLAVAQQQMAAGAQGITAGGIAAAQALLDEDLMLHRGAERSTLLERESGRAAAVLARHRVSPGDVVIIVSNSGRNAYPVEFALLARAAGAVTIALTSRQHSTAVASRHTSGKRLFELADIVLDNGGVPGDAGLQIPGLQIPGLQLPGHAGKMGPTSTIIGVWMLNLLLAEAVAQLAAEGISVDVWQSANADQGDNSAALIARWRTRLHGL